MPRERVAIATQDVDPAQSTRGAQAAVSSRQETDMRGVITRKDILRHALTIVRLFGPRTYWRCLRAAFSSEPSTFLEVVSAA
jgi:hypothetical protein